MNLRDAKSAAMALCVADRPPDRVPHAGSKWGEVEPAPRMLAVIVLIALVTGCLPDRATERAGAPLRSVKTEVTVVQPARQLRRFPSVLEPPQLVPLSFEVGGRVAEVDLRVGQRVEREELLATIEPLDLDLRLGQAEAALLEARAAAVNAQNEADRQAELARRGVVSTAARDQALTHAEQAVARMKQSQSNVDLLRKSRSDAELRAPFAAVINSVDVQDFASVQAGAPVVTLYEEGRLQASILVSLNVARDRHVGQKVRVVPSDWAGEPIPATITEIGRRAPAVSSFPLIVTLDAVDADLRSGMAVEVLIETQVSETANLIALPRSALSTVRSGPFEGVPPYPAEVFVYADAGDGTGTLEARTVAVVAAAEDRIFASEGLAPGERIVTAGVPFLRDGQTVRLFEPADRGASR